MDIISQYPVHQARVATTTLPPTTFENYTPQHTQTGHTAQFNPIHHSTFSHNSPMIPSSYNGGAEVHVGQTNLQHAIANTTAIHHLLNKLPSFDGNPENLNLFCASVRTISTRYGPQHEFNILLAIVD